MSGSSMPVEFCCACRNRHDPMDKDQCKSLGTGDIRVKRSSTKMPKTNTKDSVSDLEASASALSLEERRKKISTVSTENKLYWR